MRGLGLAAVFCLPAAAAAAAQPCRLALLLALDVSASVSQVEFDLQALGMANALTSEAVSASLLGTQPPVAIAVYHWSGPSDQALVADWVLVTDRAVLERLSATVAAYPRRVSFDGRTAIGAALRYGARQLGRAPDCRRQVIDIAVDGENNADIEPETVRDSRALSGTTVNALAVTGEVALGKLPDWLVGYLEGSVIRGPDAFVEVADGYPDFARAMERKLLRELAEVAVSALPGKADEG